MAFLAPVLPFLGATLIGGGIAAASQGLFSKIKLPAPKPEPIAPTPKKAGLDAAEAQKKARLIAKRTGGQTEYAGMNNKIEDNNIRLKALLG